MNNHFTKTTMTHTVNGKVFEVKRTDSGMTVGIFVDGKKHTDYMACEPNYRRRLAGKLDQLGAVGHTFSR